MPGQPESQRLTGIAASGCWECGGAEPPPLVYVLGRLGYDFGSEALRDWFLQMGLADPGDPAQVLAHLERHPAHGSALTWTLDQDETPIYVIQPGGAFAAETYDRLRQLLRSQLLHEIEGVVLPGRMDGRKTLANGRAVPLVWPHVRGLQGWGTRGAEATEVVSLLERVSVEARNPGRLPRDRALNFVATQGALLEGVYMPAMRAGLRLHAIEVERGPLCRPESDCWDVKMIFFDPMHRLERAREVFRLTVDVSDVLPVSLGKVHRWLSD